MRTACEDNKNPDVVLVLCCFIPKSFVTLKELSKSVFAMFREGTGRALGSTGLLLEESRAVISRVTPALSWRRIIPRSSSGPGCSEPSVPSWSRCSAPITSHHPQSSCWSPGSILWDGGPCPAYTLCSLPSWQKLGGLGTSCFGIEE